MPNFSLIKQQILDELKNNGNLFLGLTHKDKIFNKYIADNLKSALKANKVVIFAEIEGEAWRSNVGSFNALFQVELIRSSLNLTKTFDSICSTLTTINTERYNMPHASNEFIALLLTLHFSGIEIYPFNYIAKTEEEKREQAQADAVLSTFGNMPLAQLHQALEFRKSKDSVMAATIQEVLQQKVIDKKYLILAGPMHFEISTILGLKAINVVHRSFYENCLKLSPQHILEKISTSENLITYEYTDDAITPVSWQSPVVQLSSSSSSAHVEAETSELKTAMPFLMFGKTDLSNDAIAYKDKGNEAFKKKQYIDAIQNYEEAISLDATFKEAWCNKAKALYHLGKYDDALSAVSEAIKLDPSYKGAQGALKDIQLKIAEQKKLVSISTLQK